MCSRTTCKKCGKATWKGCGNHIEQALMGVPKSERCSCSSSTDTSAVARTGFLARMRSK
jgi:hypothetical protein